MRCIKFVSTGYLDQDGQERHLQQALEQIFILHGSDSDGVLQRIGPLWYSHGSHPRGLITFVLFEKFSDAQRFGTLDSATLVVFEQLLQRDRHLRNCSSDDGKNLPTTRFRIAPISGPDTALRLSGVVESDGLR